MKDKAFGVLQRVGRSFMLPIAVLPIAGILLGVGSSFTNETTLETYGLINVMGPGTVLYNILTVMNQCGSVIFGNLPVIFAIGVAIGMAKKDKEVAALSAAIAFLVMHSAINAMININGGPESMLSGSTGEVLGITTLQMGAFGGVIVGLGVAALHNRYYKIELPQALSFFGGNRFVPIISTVVYLFVGILMFYIWQPVQNGIYALGNLVQNSGYVGTFFYGFIKRMLIPFGLHHVFYMPFWQTAVGGTLDVGGETISGAQNIFFAQLADPSTTHFAVSATRFFSGEFIVMIFGLPGAALAMFRCARPEKKKEIKGLLFSAALTSILTGITEPLEFSFLFVAPLLFGIHAVLTGLAYSIAHILNIGVGLTFSGGFIDLFMFGILQGNGKTSWILIIPAGILYFIIYYFIFTFIINRFHLKTPGREENYEETKLYTRADYNEKMEKQNQDTNNSKLIADGLGGKANIQDVDCCATRLRITVNDPARVNENLLKQSGAHGVIKRGQGIQVVYGPKVNIIKAELDEYLSKISEEFSNITSNQEANQSNRVSPVISDESETIESPDTNSQSTIVVQSDSVKSDPIQSIIVGSPMKGKAVAIEDVPDPGFAEKMMGDGAAIDPVDGQVFAPIDGKISFVFPSKHAIGMVADHNINLLLHIGIDTISLNGEGFQVLVKAGDVVKKGDLLIKVDLDKIKNQVPSMITPIIVSELTKKQKIRVLTNGEINVGDDLFSIDVYE